MDKAADPHNMNKTSFSNAERDEAPEQQHSSPPSGTGRKDKDRNAGTVDFKNTLTSMIVGHEVWAVVSQTTLDDDPSLAYLVGMFSTKEKAIARVKQLVKDNPPRELINKKIEEKTDGDVVIPGELVDAFIKKHWREVRDDSGDARGMGVQYDTYDGTETHWVEDQPVQ